MSIDELRVIKVTHACVLAYPGNTHTANSWYDLFILTSYFHHSTITSMHSRAFYHSFWAITQSCTYDNQHLVCFTKAPHWSAVISWLLSYHPSHFCLMFWNNESSAALSKTPFNKAELCWDGFFAVWGPRKKSNLPQIKLKEKTVGASAWRGQGAFHYNQIDAEWLSS